MNKHRATKTPPTRQKIEQIVWNCVGTLFEKDLSLLQDDVSERAITHKLAEYLQAQIPELNVDCEYNRNFEDDEDGRKKLYFLEKDWPERIRPGLKEDELLAVSIYPDIIVHRRRTNAENLLVVEVKKRNNQESHKYDHAKLMAFTDGGDRNKYHYRYGVFILLDTDVERPANPELIWFSDGKVETKEKGGG